MNAYLEKVSARNYATTQLEATHSLVTLVTNFLQTTKHAMVGGILTCRSWNYWLNHLVLTKYITKRITNELFCLDINECLHGTNSCTQLCNNTLGSYTCYCNTGFKLATDHRTCSGKWNIVSYINACII